MRRSIVRFMRSAGLAGALGVSSYVAEQPAVMVAMPFVQGYFKEQRDKAKTEGRKPKWWWLLF